MQDQKATLIVGLCELGRCSSQCRVIREARSVGPATLSHLQGQAVQGQRHMQGSAVPPSSLSLNLLAEQYDFFWKASPVLENLGLFKCSSQKEGLGGESAPSCLYQDWSIGCFRDFDV